MVIHMNLIQHMKNFTAQAHVIKNMRVHGVKEKRENIKPSAFLNIEFRDDNIEILNPKQRGMPEVMIIEQ